jgi:hypothetical protein
MTRIDRAIATRVALLLGLFVWILPGLLSGAEADQAAAKTLFAEGRRLAATGDYAQACPKFDESYRLNPGIGTNFNLANCLEHVGRTASAWTRFLDVATATKAAGQSDRERVARARAAILEPNLSRLAVDVLSPVPGQIVYRDGIAVAELAWGLPVPVDPGDHVLEAVAPQKKKWSASVTVPPSAESIRVSVPQLEDGPAEPPLVFHPTSPATPVAALTAQQPSAKTRTRWTIPVISLASVGVVGLATGAVFALQFQSSNDEAKTLCTGNVCGTMTEKTAHQTLVDDAYRDRALAFVGAGIGGAALLTAAYLWLRPRRPIPPATASGPVGVSARPAAWAAGMGGNLEVRW